MDGTTRFWQFFKFAPGPAVVLLFFGIRHLFLKGLFSGRPKTSPKEIAKAEADGKTPNPTEANSSKWKVETIEQRGFKAVVLRLSGSGYFSEAEKKELRTLVVENCPAYGSNGKVHQYLILDLLEMEDCTEDIISLAIKAHKNFQPQNIKQPLGIPSVAFIALSQMNQILALLRMDRVFPCYADVQAAFDAMTPQGFKDVLSSRAELKAKQDLFSSKSWVENVEHRGFKVVIQRFKCEGNPDADFVAVWQQLKSSVSENCPVIMNNGKLSRFLIFDVAQVKEFTEQFVGLLIRGLFSPRQTDPRQFPAAVALIHCSDAHRTALERYRLQHILPCYADEQAAFDAMTPQGFRQALDGIVEYRAKKDITSKCTVEKVEQRGFKAVILRLKCVGNPDAWFLDVWEELQALVLGNSPAIGSNGEVSHFLIFDVAQVDYFAQVEYSADHFVGLLARAWHGIDYRMEKPTVRVFVPAVALIHGNNAQPLALELHRIDYSFPSDYPCYADVQAALDEMTPQGFRHAVAGIAERKAKKAPLAKCRVDIFKPRGFKVVILRLKCEGYPDTYYADVWPELVALVRENSPAVESNGEISHYLIFDVAQVKVFSDQFIGLLFKPLMGKDRKTHAPYTPSVALIHCTDSIRQIIELCRLHHILPCYADLHAAIDAMTPQGFSHAIAGIAEMKARQAKRDAERAAQQSLHSSPAVGSSKM